MSARDRPANRRKAINFEIEHGGHGYIVTVGMLADNVTPIEVFVTAKRSRDQIEALARDGAILASFARQYGAPFSALKAAVTRGDNGEPMTVIGAVLDAIVEAWPEPHQDDAP